MDRRPDEGERVSDERLVAEFVAGDESAFARLVDRYGRDVYQFVARFIRNAAPAEDVVQETFIQVYQSAGGFDPTRRFRPWLFTIAANKARDHLRGRARKKEVSLSLGSSSDDTEGMTFLDFLSDEEMSPGEVLEADERRDAVRAVVSEMPHHLREVLVLGYYQHFAYKEIAEILSIPLGTVKSRLHAAVSFFAEAYKKLERQKERDPRETDMRGGGE